MLFADYSETKVVYHVASITDLEKILTSGIKYDDKSTYKSKYLYFHKYLNNFRTKNIPNWVDREKAIFASMNFSDKHCWHSHSVLMAIKIDESMCWIANENLANITYEPFVLKDVEGFSEAREFIMSRGKDFATRYWSSSLSFEENLNSRLDLQDSYDAEVMIFHDIYPKDIELISIVSDHKNMSISEWKKYMKGEEIN